MMLYKNRAEWPERIPEHPGLYFGIPDNFNAQPSGLAAPLKAMLWNSW